MSKEIYISSTPHETRLAIVENDALAEIYYERENEYTLAGSIYNGKVTRVLPGMQSSFVDIGLERDAFLYITDFMEEAGDSADFEANANAGDHQRAPRREGGQRDGQRGRGEGRSEGRGRGDRDQTREGQGSAEPTDADLFTQAVAGLDPARTNGDGERGGDRSGGRRRRGRGRGEGRNQIAGDGLPRPETSRLDDAALIEGDPNDLAVTAVPLEELGEGAPGADGSRRWRGRRGRRGSQSGERASAPVAGSEPEANVEPTEPRAATGPVANAYEQDSWAEPDFSQETAGEINAVDLNAAASSSENDRQPRQEGRPDRNRSRGGRDRNDRGRNDRGGNDRDRRPREAGSEFPGDAAQAPVYGETEYAAAPIEPIILPGESLSKYRGDATAARETVAPAAAAPVASDFKLPGAWDGGMVLPGETIRPRAGVNRDAAPESGRGERDRGGRNDRGDRNDRNDRGGRNDRGDRNRNDRGRNDQGRDSRPQQASSGNGFQAEGGSETRRAQGFSKPAEQQQVEQAAAEPVAEQPSAEQFGSTHFVTPMDSTFVAPPPVPVEAASVVEDETAGEYEPVEASASYRVDPAPLSEFRQPAPVLEVEPEPTSEFVHAVEPAAEPVDSSETHAWNAAQAEGSESPEHQLTSVFATGEMHSEQVAPPAAESHDLVPQEDLEPASPIAHEAAVVGSQAPAQTLPHFEPGSGVLEEEVMEDEEEGDTVSTMTAAGHSHPFDEGDHETLEGAADLATMLREMSIDQITRTEPAVLDEEDEDDEEFDEDFEEEDQDYDASELDDEEEAEEEGEGNEEPEGFDSSRPQDSEVDEGDGASLGEGSTAAPSNAGGQNGQPREARREGRREGRRDGRRGDRNRRSASGERGSDRERSSNAGGDRTPGSDRSSERGSDRSSDRGNDRNRQHGRGGRPSMQSTNLPAISDLLKPGQELLCQIAKEPIAKKGARITSHIALPGRFLVFMPTVSHTGVSRKIESDGERRRLKEILLSEKGEAAGGFIVRTAAAGASEEELRSDLRFLLNLWNDIKARSESSKSPALIYHDLNLVERVLRDQVTDTFSAIWVDTETEYERVLRFLQRFQPSLIRRVKLYTKETPLFEQFGITEEINKALRSKVWLKSGGSIVINQTEALVAIDINTGKFVGKTARLEDTIVKTNLDAIPEIVRQIRLRDLGGIIIIDFIDMDERKNRNKVMAALEEELKLDRAPSKVLQFNDFGLVAITRKRVKQSLERTLSTTCGVCAGTGMVKSPVTVCNDIYVEMRKMQKHLDRGDVMLRVNPEVVKQLKSGSARWLQEMEEMVGKTILVKSDPALHPEQFDIH